MNDTSGDKNIPTLDQVSAGGVVYRLASSAPEIAIVHMVPEMRWQLPKGLIDRGETIEEAAVREVREESGVAADLCLRSKRSSTGLSPIAMGAVSVIISSYIFFL